MMSLVVFHREPCCTSQHVLHEMRTSIRFPFPHSLVAQMLIESPLCEQRGRTPLSVACNEGRQEVALRLVHLGADPSIGDVDVSPLTSLSPVGRGTPRAREHGRNYNNIIFSSSRILRRVVHSDFACFATFV